MFFQNALAFSMIQQMLAIWSLFPLPFLNPAWTSGSSWFMVKLKKVGKSTRPFRYDLNQIPYNYTVNHELPDVQAGFRKGRGTRDQIANIYWIIKKARVFQKSIYFCFIDYAKVFDCVDHKKLWKILTDGNTRPPDLPPEKCVCRSRNS